MRFAAIFPALCATATFVLTMLCIFAGSHPGFMEDSDIVTLNTSMLGQTLDLGGHNSSSSNSSGGGLFGDLTNGIHSLGNSIENDIENKIKEFAHDIAKALNISDFYSLHILDYCQGEYEPGPEVNETNPSPWENVTACSNRTAMFTFDPQQAIQHDLPSGINISDLEWPNYMQQVINDANGALEATFVFYCIGAAAAGLALICSVVGVFSGGALVALANSLLDMTAFLVLLIASAAVTWAINSITEVVNGLGNDIGIYAYKGTKFISMTWAATVLMFVAACAWAVDIVLGRRSGRYARKRHASKV